MCVGFRSNFNKERYVRTSAMLNFALLVDLQESYGLARPVVQQMSLKEEPDLYLETRMSWRCDD